MKVAVFIDGGHFRVLARVSGLQVVHIRFPGQRLAAEMMWHADFVRDVDWPD